MYFINATIFKLTLLLIQVIQYFTSQMPGKREDYILRVCCFFFATTLFRDLLPINWFATTKVRKAYPDPSCYNNHMTTIGS